MHLDIICRVAIISVMRTTLNIDADALSVVKSLARQKNLPVGAVVSELIFQALSKQHTATHRSGVPLLPVEGNTKPVTMELINDLRDGDA